MIDDTFRPMSIGEIFGMGWRLTRRTLPTAGLLLALIYIPFTLFLGLVMGNAIDTLVTVAMQPPHHPDPSEVNSLVLRFLMSFLVMLPLSIFMQLAIPYSQSTAIVASWEAANGRDLPMGEMLRRSLKRPFWLILVQGFIVTFLVWIGIMVCFGAVALLTVVLGQIGKVAAVLGIVLGVLVCYAAIIYFAVAISLAKHEVVAADRGPWKGLQASIALVKPHWFKTFGVSFIISFFAVLLSSIWWIPTILSFADMPRFGSYRRNDPEAALAIFRQLQAHLSPWFFLPMGVFLIAITLFSSNVYTALYLDLRARRGDYDHPHDDLTAMEDEIG